MSVKVAVLWAGQGRRIQRDYGMLHKARIPLCGEPLMAHLLRNLQRCGVEELVPVLGYQQEEMLREIEAFGGFRSIRPAVNPFYDRTNNLASLMCAEEQLCGEDFAVVNGDMVFDAGILQTLLEHPGNAIACDGKNYGYELDSPRMHIQNGQILDIGRHIPWQESQGYAVGMYRFSGEFSEEYFRLGKALAAEKPNAGYHEPLIPVLSRVRFEPAYTEGRLWMDVDEKADVPRAERMLLSLRR